MCKLKTDDCVCDESRKELSLQGLALGRARGPGYGFRLFVFPVTAYRHTAVQYTRVRIGVLTEGGPIAQLDRTSTRPSTIDVRARDSRDTSDC